MDPHYRGGAVGEGVTESAGPDRISRTRSGLKKRKNPTSAAAMTTKRKRKLIRAQIAAAGFLLLPTGTLLHQLELEQAREFFRISFFRVVLAIEHHSEH